MNLSQAFTLDCIADGNPMPTIDWLKDGAQLGNRENLRFVGSQLQFTSKFHHDYRILYYVITFVVPGVIFFSFSFFFF